MRNIVIEVIRSRRFSPATSPRPAARFVLAAACALLCSVVVGTTGRVSADVHEDIAGESVARTDPDSLAAALATLTEVVQWLHRSYVDELSPELLLEAAMEGICRKLDPQTGLLSESEWERLIEGTSSGYVGIGVGLGCDGELPVVRSVQRGSPAGSAGIRPGDRFVYANGTCLRGLAPGDVSRLIRGPSGSALRLEILEPSGRSSRRLLVERQHLELPAVEASRIRGGRVGVVRILRFGVGTASELRDVLEEWDGLPLEGLLVDLRGNPGGLFDEAAAAASMFLDEGTEIVRTESRLIEERECIRSGNPALFSGLNMVLLVDSLTASSAEVFAGALQGAGAAAIAGEETYGKRTIQRFKALKRGGALRLTTSRFVTPGDAVDRQRVRLAPDARLERKPVSEWIAACDSAGLLTRFLELDTLTPADLAAWTAWSGGVPGDWRLFEASAPGCRAWRERLIASLEEWGLVGAATGCPAGDDPGLRALWLADWAGERWGDGAAASVSTELDPWVAQAADRFFHPSTALARRSALAAD